MSGQTETVQTINLEKSTVVLLDVAGTTTSNDFVKDTLFPYAISNVEEYLKENWEQENVKSIIQGLKAEDELDVEKAVLRFKEVNEKDENNEHIKALQALIYIKGCEGGSLITHVFADVPTALENWAKTKRIAVYSSGNLAAQKLLLAHTVEGDIAKHISNFFDLSVGLKTNSESYKKIAKELSVPTEEILYINDKPEEAKAAKEAGVNAVLIAREGNSELADADKKAFVVLSSFAEVSEFSGKRKNEDIEAIEAPPSKVARTDTEAETEKPESVTNGDTKTTKVADIEAMEVDESDANVEAKPAEQLCKNAEIVESEVPNLAKTTNVESTETCKMDEDSVTEMTTETPKSKKEEEQVPVKSEPAKAETKIEDTKANTDNTKVSEEIVAPKSTETKDTIEPVEDMEKDDKSAKKGNKTEDTAIENIAKMEEDSKVEKQVQHPESTKTEDVEQNKMLEEPKSETKETVEESKGKDTNESVVGTDQKKTQQNEEILKKSEDVETVGDNTQVKSPEQTNVEKQEEPNIEKVEQVKNDKAAQTKDDKAEETKDEKVEQTKVDEAEQAKTEKLEKESSDVKVEKPAKESPVIIKTNKTQMASNEKAAETTDVKVEEKDKLKPTKTEKTETVSNEKVVETTEVKIEEKDTLKTTNDADTKAVETIQSKVETKVIENCNETKESKSDEHNTISEEKTAESKIGDEEEKVNGENEVCSEEKENKSELANGSAQIDSEVKKNGDVENKANEEEIKVKKIDDTVTSDVPPVSVEV